MNISGHYTSKFTVWFILFLSTLVQIFPATQNRLITFQDKKILSDNIIYIESKKYENLNDTERIDKASADAARENARLIFGNRTYNYTGSKSINFDVNWKGTQGTYYNNTETVINITGRWTFNGAGSSVIKGIAVNGNRTFTGDLIRVNSNVDSIEFENCHFMGALHRKGSDAAIVLNINGNVKSVIFNNGTLSDAHSEAAIELASTNGSTSGGWRIWPSIRAFNASGFDGYLEMRNVDIFDIGNEVVYENGDKVWNNPRKGGLNPGGWDIDAWQRSGRDGTGYTLLENIYFYSSPGSFIKVSSNGGELNFRNVDIHIRAGEPIAGRPIRLQSHGSGAQRNGKMEKVTIRADRSRDLTYLGGASALHMLMSFSGNLPDETFHIKDTVIEIGVNEENPVFLSNQAIFGYHRTTSPKYGLIIENTKVNVPGGIEWFFRTSTNASGSAKRARERVNQVTFVNNKEMKHLRRFYYANPFGSSCSGCNVYTYHEVTMKGLNSYFNMNGNLHEVTPQISPDDIWRSGGGTFTDCACESDILQMYLFDLNEKK